MQVVGADEEKPFLQHLDDLRSMIVRMLLTLIVVTLACCPFVNVLMDVLRHPADQVWVLHEEAHLPQGITAADWGAAKALAYTINDAEGKLFKTALKGDTEEKKGLVESALLLRTARLLDEPRRAQFIKEAASSPKVAALAESLEKSGAVLTEDGGRGALKMMSAFVPSEGFMLSIKLAIYSGIIISSPFLIYFLLQFIVPGLMENERKVLYRSMFYGFGLFLIGISFAYFIVLPRVLTFFYEYSIDLGIANEWRIGYYVSFALQLVLLFGLAFELPIVIYPFIRLGVLNYDLMTRTRRYAVVGVAALSAVITPTPDAMTMLLMAVPMYALYEFCILLAWREQKRKAKLEQEEQAAAETAYGLTSED